MKIIYPTASTRQFYQQNSITRAQNRTSGAIAPHADGNVFTYTVPTGRRALLTCTSVYLQRVTVAAPEGIVRAHFSLTINGVTTDFGSCSLVGNTAITQAALTVPVQIWLNAGDTVTCFDGDTSTGGTVIYQESISYIEFDQ